MSLRTLIAAIVACLLLAGPASGQTEREGDEVRKPARLTLPPAPWLGYFGAVEEELEDRSTSLVDSLLSSIVAEPSELLTPRSEGWDALDYSPVAPGRYSTSPFYLRDRARYWIGVRIPLAIQPD